MGGDANAAGRREHGRRKGRGAGQPERTRSSRNEARRQRPGAELQRADQHRCQTENYRRSATEPVQQRRAKFTAGTGCNRRKSGSEAGAGSSRWWIHESGQHRGMRGATDRPGGIATETGGTKRGSDEVAGDRSGIRAASLSHSARPAECAMSGGMHFVVCASERQKRRSIPAVSGAGRGLSGVPPSTSMLSEEGCARKDDIDKGERAGRSGCVSKKDGGAGKS